MEIVVAFSVVRASRVGGAWVAAAVGNEHRAGCRGSIRGGAARQRDRPAASGFGTASLAEPAADNRDATEHVMANQATGAPAQTEAAEFETFAYAGKDRVDGYAVKTIDGKRQRVRVPLAEGGVPKRLSIVVNMVAPDKFSPGGFGGGWYTLLKVIPPDTGFATRLRAELEKAAQYVSVWDLDKGVGGEPVAMLATEAHKLGLLGSSSRRSASI